ncbi:uncharacterized protein [Diadema antillarum]|uniref:uncharacterized protein n=1 Tax=Diadema antillarum TaxID=105358 RepID=UPI003A87FCBD
MKKLPFMMGQTKQEDFAADASKSLQRPQKFATQDFSFHAKNSNGNDPGASQCPIRDNSAPKDQPGRPSTPFPENEVQFLPNANDTYPEPSAESLVHVGVSGERFVSGVGEGMFPNANSMGATSVSQRSPVHRHQVGADHRRPPLLPQQQSWPPSHIYYSQDPAPQVNGSREQQQHQASPFAPIQRVGSFDGAVQGQPSHSHATPLLMSPEKEEKVPNSAARRSRVWKYGRRSSGSYTDRQPFMFSVSAAHSGPMTSMESGGARFFGKRAFPSTSCDESWSTEPTHKQFISEERMAAEMHNLSLDGFHKPLLFPSQSTPSVAAMATPPLARESPPCPHSSLPSHLRQDHTSHPCLPSTSGSTSAQSSNLLRHHQCHHYAQPKPSARAVIADIERRLDDSDDEGVEEDMPPSSDCQRLEMTPQLALALKAKGAENHVLPADIVKKIATSPCMELVLWRPPPSILNLRGGPDSPSKSPSASPSPLGSELAPIMEVEVERERAEASAMSHQQPPYGATAMPGNGMQEGLPDYDEDMDL